MPSDTKQGHSFVVTCGTGLTLGHWVLRDPIHMKSLHCPNNMLE
jgi:hypothetical protein